MNTFEWVTVVNVSVLVINAWLSSIRISRLEKRVLGVGVKR